VLVVKVSPRFPLYSTGAAALGVLNAVSFLAPAGWILQLITLAALFGLTLRQPYAVAAARGGFAFGLGWFLVGISWIYISLHTYGFLPFWLAGLATLLLCAYLALYPALALGMTGWLLGRGVRRGTVLCALPVLWTGSELLRGVVLTGFPWLAIGYAQTDGPLAGIAPLLGVYGVGLASTVVAAALYTFGRRGIRPNDRMRALAALLLPFLVALGASHWNFSSDEGKPLRVTLLQGNVAQDTKFDRDEFDRTIDVYFKLIDGASGDLVVLPETALPVFFDNLPPGVIERLHQEADQKHMTIAVGVPIADSASVYTNSMVTFTPGETALRRYDKVHLVPFGEFVPIGFHWFVRMLHIPLGDFTAGAREPAPMPLAGHTLGFDICYEDLFGEPIAHQAVRASVLINASNVAWFGDSLALPEHLQIARMRALEAARPMLRATNTGMTAAIDAHGHVIGELAPYTRAALSVSVQPMIGSTPYSLYGDAPLWVLLALGLGGMWLAQRDALKRSRRLG
jgi:apolipoprotein N-acyltransferase